MFSFTPVSKIPSARVFAALRECSLSSVPHQHIRIAWDRRNAGLAHLVDAVREEHVINLVSKLLADHCESLRLFHVRAGLSGAAAIGVECNFETPRGRRARKRSVVLKLSRDRGLIEGECEKRRETRYFPEGLFPRFEDVPPQDSGGWYAIATDYVYGAETFRKWLSTPAATPTTLRDLLGGLFLDAGLKEVYRPPVRHDDLRRDVALHSVLTPSRRARILLALDELAPLTRRHDPTATFAGERVRRFVEEARFEGSEATHLPVSVLFTRSHGDLHSENILVDQRSRPWLIDPGDIDILPWPSDIARLAVDLIVAGLDGDHSTHEWDGLQRWLTLAIRYIARQPLGTSDTDAPNQCVHTTLEWLRDHVHFIHDLHDQDEAEGQFRLGLAIEFLRASYRVSELPTPKRVLALLAGDIALSGSLVPW